MRRLGGEIPAAAEGRGLRGQDVRVPALEAQPRGGFGQVLLAAGEAEHEVRSVGVLHAAAAVQRVQQGPRRPWGRAVQRRSRLLLVGAALGALLRHLLHRRELAQLAAPLQAGRVFVVLQRVLGGGEALPRGGHAAAARRVGHGFDIQGKGALQAVAVLQLVQGDVQPVQALQQRAVLQRGRLLGLQQLRGEAALPRFQHLLAALLQVQQLQLAEVAGLAALVLDLLLKVQKLAQEVEVGRNGWPLFFHESGKRGQANQELFQEPAAQV